MRPPSIVLLVSSDSLQTHVCYLLVNFSGVRHHGCQGLAQDLREVLASCSPSAREVFALESGRRSNEMLCVPSSARELLALEPVRLSREMRCAPPFARGLRELLFLLPVAGVFASVLHESSSRGVPKMRRLPSVRRNARRVATAVFLLLVAGMLASFVHEQSSQWLRTRGLRKLLLLFVLQNGCQRLTHDPRENPPQLVLKRQLTRQMSTCQFRICRRREFGDICVTLPQGFSCGGLSQIGSDETPDDVVSDSTSTLPPAEFNFSNAFGAPPRSPPTLGLNVAPATKWEDTKAQSTKTDSLSNMSTKIV